MLFSEPKIPQYYGTVRTLERNQAFQCSSASRKFLNCTDRGRRDPTPSRFSALQRAENSSIRPQRFRFKYVKYDVSVLFSEPKIPQSLMRSSVSLLLSRFSALQRAENSSMLFVCLEGWVLTKFQCSSASRKFLNLAAERRRCGDCRFQCSSASRKFLNSVLIWLQANCAIGFSALQRAENSSINEPDRTPRLTSAVSVLFSEPKIPQYKAYFAYLKRNRCFSALQRAENSSI